MQFNICTLLFKITITNIYKKNITIFALFQKEMNNQINSTSGLVKHDASLKNIFGINQIVQSYKQSRSSNHLIYSGHHSHSNNRPIHSPLIVQKPLIQKASSIHNRFMQDDIFQELNAHQIVENFSMIDQRDEQYQPYENVFKGRGQFEHKLNQKMFASSSQNNDVPSRNSSLSSLSDNNHLNISLNHSIDRIQKKNKLGFLDDIAYDIKKISENFNSQNEMDIQNSAFPNQKVKQKNINNFTTPKNIQTPNLVQNQRKNLFFNNDSGINKSHHVQSFRRIDIDSDRQKKQRLQKIQKIQQIGCNCRKSKCLKMYCQCFNLQIFCNQNCNCCGCGNQQPTDDHQKAVLDALTRNPKAFNQVTQKIQQTFNLGIELNEVKKGCKCKKTKCLKKYCECYNSGQGCGKFCKCQGCQNC